jgi:hypothetical protein
MHNDVKYEKRTSNVEWCIEHDDHMLSGSTFLGAGVEWRQITLALRPFYCPYPTQKGQSIDGLVTRWP